MTSSADVLSFSKALFGSRYRLPVAVALATMASDELYVHAVAEHLGVAHNLVAGEVRRLEQVGLLRRRVVGRRLLYERLPSPFWAFAIEMSDSLEGTRVRSLEASLIAGESDHLEVQGSVFGPGQQAREPEELARDTQPFLRCIAAFANTAGGTVIIGAVGADARQALEESQPVAAAEPPRLGPWVVTGLLDPVYTRLGWNAWEKDLRELIARRIEPPIQHLVAIEQVNIAGRKVASVAVHPSREPFFVTEADGEHRFWVRLGAASRLLVGPDMARYWVSRANDVLKVAHHGSLSPELDD